MSDKCKWEYDRINKYYAPECLDDDIIEFNNEFKYCPYCSKPIEVEGYEGSSLNL